MPSFMFLVGSPALMEYFTLETDEADQFLKVSRHIHPTIVVSFALQAHPLQQSSVFPCVLMLLLSFWYTYVTEPCSRSVQLEFMINSRINLYQQIMRWKRIFVSTYFRNTLLLLLLFFVLVLFSFERPLHKDLRLLFSNRIGKKFGRTILQVNTHRLTDF